MAKYKSYLSEIIVCAVVFIVITAVFAAYQPNEDIDLEEEYDIIDAVDITATGTVTGGTVTDGTMTSTAGVLSASKITATTAIYVIDTTIGLYSIGGNLYFYDTVSYTYSLANIKTAFDHSQIVGGDSVHVSTTENTNWDTGYSHSQDNTQAHSDYLLNNDNDTTSGIITAGGLTTTGNLSDGVNTLTIAQINGIITAVYLYSLDTGTENQILALTAAGELYYVDMPTGGGSGDMTKAVYDTDTDDRVDVAEGINDGTYSTTAQQIQEIMSKYAPIDATYITQTSNGTLSNEQVLSSLSTGILKVTTGTGVLTSLAAIAVADRIYSSDGVTWEVLPRTDCYKIITATRAGDANSGNVSYSGVGFAPGLIIAFATETDAGGGCFSAGASTGSSTNQCVLISMAMSAWGVNSSALILISDDSLLQWYQSAVIASIDADGFTLTWTEGDTGITGNIAMVFVCFR